MLCTDAGYCKPVSLDAVMDSFDTVFGTKILLSNLITESTLMISTGGHD